MSLPKLWARLAQVELQEPLPDQRQERVVGGRGQGLLGPAVDHHPLQGGHHVNLQTHLSFLSTAETIMFWLLSYLMVDIRPRTHYALLLTPSGDPMFPL